VFFLTVARSVAAATKRDLDGGAKGLWRRAPRLWFLEGVTELHRGTVEAQQSVMVARWVDRC
jgi:hypothetical protein